MASITFATLGSNGKIKVNVELELTADCWPVQTHGLTACKTCEFKGTADCGGGATLKKLKEAANVIQGT